MKSFKINDNGDLVINEMVEGDEELIQCLKHLIYTRVGEWFLNLNYGFDRSVIEQKKYDEREITQALYDAIYQEPRIKQVTSLTFEFDKINRHLKINFTAVTADGGEINVNL